LKSIKDYNKLDILKENTKYFITSLGETKYGKNKKYSMDLKDENGKIL